MRMMTRTGALLLCLTLIFALLTPLALADAGSTGGTGSTDAPASGTAAPTRTPRPTTPPRVTATPRPQVVTDDAPTFNSLADVIPGATDAQDITKACNIKVSEGKAARMLDDKQSSVWTNKKAKAKVTITLPKGEVAGGLYIEWGKKPGDFSLIEYDDKGDQIANSGRNISYVGFVNYYSLTEATRKVVISFAKKGNAIATLNVYSAGDLPKSVQNFDLPVRKAELMVLVAHPGDEFLYMGGTIPYYSAAMGRQVQVVYMGTPGRSVINEALTGLWTAGHRSYPDFLGFSNKAAKDQKAASKLWNANKAREALVDRIRHYKPEVIVTNDSRGEGGDGSASLLAKLTQEAVEQAADASKYKKSFDKYGAWQVKKLYLHLGNENQITMNWTDTLPELSDRSPSELARGGYAAYKALSKSKRYAEGGSTDNASFGLVMTEVGADILKNDMLENIAVADPDDPALSLLPSDDEEYEDDFPAAEDDEAEDEYDDWEDDGLDAEEDNADDALPTSGTVTPPTDTAPPFEPNIPLIVMLAGAPVVLTGGVFGFVYGQKYYKKMRRLKRRAARKGEPPNPEPPKAGRA